LPPDVAADVIRGMYLFRREQPEASTGYVRLLGSGAILPEVIAAAQMLASDWRVGSDIFSVTSFSELARDARKTERWNRCHPEQEEGRSHVAAMLQGDAPIVAATDYVRAYPQLIASYLRAPFVALGTDGFGRSDTRAALREFFEVDRRSIVVAALHSLARAGVVAAGVVTEATQRYGMDREQNPSWER